MTRKEQIKEAAKNFSGGGDYSIDCDKPSLELGFLRGAEWCDENPTYKLESIPKGSYVVVRSNFPETCCPMPGWKEAGLLGGAIVPMDTEFIIEPEDNSIQMLDLRKLMAEAIGKLIELDAENKRLKGKMK